MPRPSSPPPQSQPPQAQQGPSSAFPNAEESLALQASLLDADRALAAWSELSRIGRPDGPGIAWIAPLLMANIAPLLPNDPWVKSYPHFLTLCRLKGRAVTEAAEITLRYLEEAQVKSLALKGLALGATVYPSPGLRTVSDIDILVPVSDFLRASEALKKRGLKPAAEEPKTLEDLRGNHAHSFYAVKKHAPSLDLHWHVLSSARGDDDDAAFWAGAVPIVVGSTPTRALCPEDQLLHILIHGVRWTRMPHVRWVADAALILRASSVDFRTERFLEGAQRLDAVTSVQEGLRFVFDLLGEGEALLDQIGRVTRSPFARHAFKARATAYEKRTVTDRIALRIESALWSRRASRKTPKG
ncbi:MAG: nucleotidyltransferase family protein [Vicinamibacteria bacterium]